MKIKRSFSFLFILLLAPLFSSCAYMKTTTAPRTLSIKKQWVSSTLKSEEKGFLHYHNMEPIVTQDTIYQGNATDGISAYNRTTGRTLWRLNLKGGMAGGAALIDNHLYFGANDGYFYSVRANTGEIEWTFLTKSESLSSPSISKDIIYFLSGKDTLYALDRKTGRQKWLYARQGLSNMSIRSGSRPLVYNSTVYTGFADGTFVALKSKNGQVKWERQLSSNKKFRDIDASPVRDGNHLYVPSYDGHLFRLDLNGEVLWRVDGGSYTPVTIKGNNLFYSSSNGFIFCLR